METSKARSIDEICKEVESNGFSGLSDEEISVYVEHQKDIAANEALYKAHVEVYNAHLEQVAETQSKIAEKAESTLNALLNAPLNLRSV